MSQYNLLYVKKDQKFKRLNHRLQKVKIHERLALIRVISYFTCIKKIFQLNALFIITSIIILILNSIKYN